MGLFDFFKKKEVAFEQIDNRTALSRILNGEEEVTAITRDTALQLPSLKAGVDYIADLVSSLEVKLYKDIGGKVETIEDYRLKLINDDTGDMLNGFQTKQSITRDFLLNGNGYIYINKNRNKIKSLHYIKPSNISTVSDVDVIFKKSKILIYGEPYDPEEFVILAQNTTDGVTGKGLLDESADLLQLAYNTLSFSSKNMAQGGIKRGVVKSAKRLSQEAMDSLKQAWSSLYGSNNTSSAII